MGRRRKKSKGQPKSYWTDDAILDAVRVWCRQHNIHGTYRLGSSSLFSSFVSPSGAFQEHMGQGRALYYRTVSRLYILDKDKLESVFSEENRLDVEDSFDRFTSPYRHTITVDW